MSDSSSTTPSIRLLVFSTFLVIILISIGIAGYYVLGWQAQYPPLDESPEQIVPRGTSSPSAAQSPNPNAQTTAKLDVPEKYAGFSSWQEKKASEASQAWFPVLRIIERKTKKSQERPLPGKVWTTTQGAISDRTKLTKLTNDLNRYYEGLLTRKGWTYELSSEEFQLQAIQKNTQEGKLTGYIGYESGRIRILSLLTRTTYASAPSRSPAKCPCTFTVDLFISDLLPLDKDFLSGVQ